MNLGQYIGTEQIDSEYKEFCLKHLPYDYFSDDDILGIIAGNWHPKLNNIILQNIDVYIESYLTKCMSAFVNSNIYGNLVIGCNDFGEITGIPYFAKDETDFQSLKENIIEKINLECSKTLSENIPIDITIQELNINRLFLEDELKPLMLSYEKKLKEYCVLNKDYVIRKDLWMKKILKYSAKLDILLNTPSIRRELMLFIIENDGSKDVINLILNSDYIKPPSGDDMKNARDNKSPDTLAYWMANFKDTRLDDIMKVRPKRPRKQIPQNPFMILHRLSLFRYKFSKLKNVKYFTIKVGIKSLEGKGDNIISYKDTRLNQWVSNIRLFKLGEPCLERIQS